MFNRFPKKSFPIENHRAINWYKGLELNSTYKICWNYAFVIMTVQVVFWYNNYCFSGVGSYV